MDALVSTDWLEQELGNLDLRILDATWFLESGRDAPGDYRAAHIPGALFMDLNDLADTETDLPNMLPPARKFADRMGALGVGDGDRIVVYDNSSHHTSARAWWMLRAFGIDNVALLDGGLAKWLAEGRPIESGDTAPRPRSLKVAFDARHLRTLAQMKDNAVSGVEQVADARSTRRFEGEGPEPRAGVQPGHIPGSRNLPYDRLFNPDGTWKRGDALKAEFEAAGIDLDRPVTTTCGSGITASVLAFGMALLGKADVALYDGSWSEWGGDSSTPKATGAA